jgi:phosphate starvation-inducible PhoH-like protein
VAAERRVAIPASINMVAVLGPRDEYLHVLEKALAADVRRTWTPQPTSSPS